MLKKIMVLLLTGMVSIVYIEAYADVKNPNQMNAITKIGGNTPSIKLAMNDVMQLPDSGKKRAKDKPIETNKSANQLSKIPAQAWLILTALFCFVMRSSRRIV